MNFPLDIALDAVVILLLIAAVRWFRTPEGARTGNLMAGLAMVCAVALVLRPIPSPILMPMVVLAALSVGMVSGWAVARRVTMIQIPAMVAFQHGAGGCAVLLVSLVELSRGTGELTGVSKMSAIAGLVIGAATFGASLLAGAKLANLIRQAPTRLPAHNAILAAITVVTFLLCAIAQQTSAPAITWLSLLLITLSIVLSCLFAIRVGGADMPVLISFLNATSGLAAAFCGAAVHNRLLIACGATVASSGSLLTRAMCKAMNRNLLNVFIGIQSASSSSQPMRDLRDPKSDARAPETKSASSVSPVDRAVAILDAAHSVVIIPGYGMALAQAQFGVRDLADNLEKAGKTVKFAIHPVAGRMPGHMNVLLAEAGVDYDKLFEIDVINPELRGTDVVLIVGACDVVNPAAIEKEGTPISGMPILMAAEAKAVIVCNLDERPGYSGVENPLYLMDRTVMLVGDAKETIARLMIFRKI